MCLTVYFDRKEIIAKDNYYVYKVMKPDLKSEYKSFQYEIGKKYKTKFGIINTTFYKDYHEGFHYFKTASRAWRYAMLGQIVVRCIVPKGSKYINNDYETGVANSIIIDKIMKP